MKNEALRTVFMTAAIFAAISGFVSPLTPEARADASAAAAAASAAAFNAAAIADKQLHDLMAIDAVIANPSEENIDGLRARGTIDRAAIPYIRETVAEMSIPPETNPENITQQQRNNFIDLLYQKHLIAQISSPTEYEAVSKGLPPDLAYSYFSTCKTERGYSAKVTFAQASDVMACMKNRHWENDTKPILVKASLAAGAILLLAGGLFAIEIREDVRKKKQPERYI